MNKSDAEDLISTPVEQLRPKQKDELNLMLLKEILKTLRYIEKSIRPASTPAHAIELEAKPKNKPGKSEDKK